MKLTRRQYDRKTAYKIDPILASQVEVVELPLCRVNGEIGTEQFHALDHIDTVELTPASEHHAARTYQTRRNWLRVTAAVIITLAALPFMPRADTTDAHGTSIVSSDVTRLVQFCLNEFGYSIAIDSVYGPQTTGAVKHFQSSSGLVADGIAGPLTLKALDTAGCRFQAPMPQVAVGTPPVPSGGNWQCPQWHGLLVANGMPVAFFDHVIDRETGGTCNPNAYNGVNRDRSYGLTQINTYGDNWGELQWRCGLSYREQLFDPATNIRCAGILYRTYGTRPWT